MATDKRPYHHGDLKNALVEAAVALIEKDGIEAVSVREAAKRVGVSPGAPFRHFASRTALLTAVAEEAMARLSAAIEAALARAAGETALEQYRALGHAFLTWAFANPTHFQVISTRKVIDFEGSGLAAANNKIRATMRQLLETARLQGEIGSADVDAVMLSTRALAYGLARMYIDGQMASWDVDPQDGLRLACQLIDQQLAQLRRA
jgi:AcrR family transcriptional regulator